MLIATRTLKLLRDGGDIDVPVRLYQPEQADGFWRCRFEIDWPDRTQKLAGNGIDAMQALWLALQLIGTTLYVSQHHESGDLSFDGRGRGYGFPVPANLRDMLIGDDARYF